MGERERRTGADTPAVRRWIRRWAVGVMAAAFVVAPVALPGAAAPARAFAQDAPKEAPKKSVDEAQVFFGDAREWTKPAEVDADAVYNAIPEYREILDQKLDPADPKYGVLMTKARKKFLAAVRASAKEGGYDLVAGVGAVTGVEGVPVITTDVIGRL